MRTHCLLLEHARPPISPRRHRGVVRRLAGGRLRYSASPIHFDAFPPRRRRASAAVHPLNAPGRPRRRRDPVVSRRPAPHAAASRTSGRKGVSHQRAPRPKPEAMEVGGRPPAGASRAACVQTQSVSWDPCGVTGPERDAKLQGRAQFTEPRV